MENNASKQPQMPEALGTVDSPAEWVKAIMNGDLKGLSDVNKIKYYNTVCKSVGLNPLTKPFQYILLKGTLVLYASKNACEQLRNIHEISLELVSRENAHGIYTVEVRARKRDGRMDFGTGSVSVKGLDGEALANAFMKAETKAKNRATLSICGLGMLDETEIESIPLKERKKYEFTDEQEIEELKKLIIELNVPEAYVKDYFKKKGIEDYTEMTKEMVSAWMQRLKAKKLELTQAQTTKVLADEFLGTENVEAAA